MVYCSIAVGFHITLWLAFFTNTLKFFGRRKKKQEMTGPMTGAREVFSTKFCFGEKLQL